MHGIILQTHTGAAEIVVAAAGIPGLITAKHIAEGAVVIDVGTTATDDGRLLGDVDAASVEDARGIDSGTGRCWTGNDGLASPAHPVQSASTQIDRLRTQTPTDLAVASTRHW